MILLFTPNDPCLCVPLYILSSLPNIIINAISLKDYRRKLKTQKQRVNSSESPRVSFKPLIIW